MTFSKRDLFCGAQRGIAFLFLMALSVPQAATAAVGDHVWSHGFTEGGFSAVDGTGAIASAGNFWSPVSFGGPTLTPVSFGGDVYLTRHDGNGNHLWSLQFVPNGACSIDAVGADESGNIFIAGTLSGGGFAAGKEERAPAFAGTIDFGGGPISGDFELFIAGFDSDGTHLFSQVLGEGFARSLAAGSGLVYLTGYTYSSLDFGGGPIGTGLGADGFLGAVTLTGAHAWSRGFTGTGDQGGMAVVTDPTGGCVLAGGIDAPTSFGGAVLSASDPDLCLARYSSAGTHLWSQVFDGTFNGGAGIYFEVGLDHSPVDDRIALSGEIYNTSEVGGAPMTSQGQGDIFLAVYDGSGTHLWSSQYGGTSYDAAQGAQFDAQGNLFVSGTFASNACSFGGAAFSPVAAFTDFFVALYDPSGNHLWSNALGYSSGQYLLKAEGHPSGDFIVWGSASGGTDMGGGPLTGGALVHARYEGTASTATATPTPRSAAILHPAAPNPFNPLTVVRVSLSRDSRAELGIFDARGRLVNTLHRGPLGAGDHDFVWQGQQDDGTLVGSGVYFARLESEGDRQVQKVVLVK